MPLPPSNPAQMTPPTPQRPTLVSVIAWLMIVGSGVGLLLSMGWGRVAVIALLALGVVGAHHAPDAGAGQGRVRRSATLRG